MYDYTVNHHCSFIAGTSSLKHGRSRSGSFVTNTEVSGKVVMNVKLAANVNNLEYVPALHLWNIHFSEKVFHVFMNVLQ